MESFIPQMEPWFGEEERIAMDDYLGHGGWITEFKKTQEFEQMIAEFTGAKHCIVVNNGTISLTLAALAAGIKAGVEVIVPNFTMIATPNSIKMFGAKPVVVDVEPETLCLNIDLVKKAITSKTKAIFFVSANGRYPKSGIEAFVNLAKENNLILLEDSAQSLGSFYPNGKHIGREGLIGSFSFSAPKVISTGQGGALITDDDDMAHKIKRLKDFGRSGGGNDIHDSIGWNFKFTDIQAVIGIEQMKKLQWRVDRKKEIWKLYKEQLKDISQIKFFDQDIKNTTPWFMDVLANDRENLQSYLKEQGIGTRIMYPPINKQKAYNIGGEYSISNLVGEKGLWLPSAAQLSDNEIIKITNGIHQFYS
ncbi:MAG: DegT/DnrJ/EryC1/StrS family aminotransferase [Prolixibacteraceae bacterium]|jgi:perosamine synthetase|nr:DegT/DnrJ/EryC1/StrS family aminotransferase [Prolixibacteraceae bacterium]